MAILHLPFTMLLHAVCIISALLCFVQHGASASSEVSYYHNDSLLWGPYRPNLFLGLRPRISNSLLIGLMWIENDNTEDLALNLRHSTDHDVGMAGYGWTSYDPRTGGVQVFHDITNKVNLTVEYAKDTSDVTGSRWGLRLTGVLREDAPPTQKTRVLFYVAAEETNAVIKCAASPKNPASYSMHTLCSGNSTTVPKYEIEILANPSQEDGRLRALASLSSYEMPAETIWPVQSILTNQLQKTDPSTKVAKDSKHANLQVVEVTYTGNFDSDITFNTGHAATTDTSAALTRDIKAANNAFHSRFDAVYKPQPPFDTPEYAFFSKQILSDLLGGVGYFHGDHLVVPNEEVEHARHGRLDTNAKPQGPYSLLTGTPSRPHYPRGYLFDEGFHLQVIADWDMDLALDILVSWINLTDSSGWIAREQILGPEARSKISPEHQPQFQYEVTPLSIFSVLEMYIDRLNGAVKYHGVPCRRLKDVPTGEAFIRTFYTKIQAHYERYRDTLAGNIDGYQYLRPALKENFTEGYRWRGRDGETILASGLADYPRSTSPSVDELHIDALSWITIAANAMRKAAIVLGLRYNPAGDAFRYDNYALEAGEVAVTIHWSERDQAYCDATLKRGRLQHICHKGYVSLMPFMTDTIFSQSLERGHVAAILDLMTDPGQLWSAYGVRSLSRRDALYGKGEQNRFRSPIWVNMNYLLLLRLYDMAELDGQYKKRAARIYTELRRNIVATVYESWKETGTVWEHYDPETGKGQGKSHFTGSSSLVVRIMAMPDLEGKIADMAGDDLPVSSVSSVRLPSSFVSAPAGLSQHSIIVLAVVLVACIIFRRALLVAWRRSVGRVFGR